GGSFRHGHAEVPGADQGRPVAAFAGAGRRWDYAVCGQQRQRNDSVVDLDKGAQTGLVRFTPLPFNSNVSLVTPSVIASSLRGPQVIMSNGSLWRVVGNQVLPRALNTSVFGSSRTLSGPTQTMASTPNGEFIFLL